MHAREALAPEAEWRAATGEARAQEALQEVPAALAAYGRAEELLERESLLIPMHQGRDTFLGQRDDATRRHLDLLLRAGRPGEALGLARRARSRFLRTLEVSVRLAGLPPDERQAWDRALAAHHAQREALDRAAAEHWRLPGNELRQAVEDRARRLRELRGEIDALLARFGIAGASEAAPPPLAAGEVLLAFHPLPDGWAGFAADATGVVARRLGRVEDVLEQPALVAERLLVPFAAQIRRARQVRLLPYGPLRRVDLHALPFDSDVLLAAKPVAYALDLPASPAAALQGARALVVGDPQGNLPGARSEAGQVEAELQAGRPSPEVRVLLGRQATGPAVRPLLAASGLFHYAGHAVFAGWDSHLPLAAGGRLTVDDVLALPRSPARVVLSGCETGASSEESAVESIGLAHAFLAAGSTTVIAAVRPVADRESAALMQSFYAELPAERLDGGGPAPRPAHLATEGRELRLAELPRLRSLRDPNMSPRPTIDPLQILSVLTLAAALLALPAAAQYPVTIPPEGPRIDQTPPSSSDERAACPAWRWIGIKTDPCVECPAPRQPDWKVRPLFSQTDRGQSILPLGLRSFCLYEHPGSGGTLTLAELPGLSALDRDCMAVLPAEQPPAPRPARAPAPPSLLRTALPLMEERFLSYAGTSGSAPVGDARVRLALLDTAPTAEDPTARPNNNYSSPHGYSLANMARKLACAGATCAARVTSQLALPRPAYNPASGAASAPDLVRGGSVGTMGDLAEAIRKEVVAWQQPGQPPFLLLNLSLGWNGRRFGGLEDDLSTARPAVQAVHAALVDAICRGASTLAAAGNRSWGPDPELGRGPLLPAAWEVRPAPVPAACAAALSPGGLPALAGAGTASYRPLIHAVGGVRAGGSLLLNSRLAGEPRLVAFGDHAVVADRFGAPTAMLTGTSVSTVVAATALAWVRHQLPALDSFAAADRLHQYGGDLRRPAAFCLGGKAATPCPAAGRPPVRHVDVRTTAGRSCAECKGPGCPRCPSFDRQTIPLRIVVEGRQSIARAFAGAPQVDRSALRPASPPTFAACPTATIAAKLSTAPGGAATERLFLPAGLAVPPFRCPHWQSFDTNLEAAVGPQPGSNPCTTCSLDPGGGGGASATAFIEIDPDYADASALSSATLKVGGETYALDLRTRKKLVVKGLPAGVTADTIQLSFVVNGKSSTTSPFLVP